jgi:hypothetical protein
MPLLIDAFVTAEDGWEVTANALIVANVAGIVAGLLYRAGAIIILSLAGLIAVVIISLTNQWPFIPSLLFGFALLAVLQIGYLLGVGIAVFRAGKKTEDTPHTAINAVSERDTRG